MVAVGKVGMSQVASTSEYLSSTSPDLPHRTRPRPHQALVCQWSSGRTDRITILSDSQPDFWRIVSTIQHDYTNPLRSKGHLGQPYPPTHGWREGRTT